MVDKLLLEKIPIECGLLSDSSATSNGFGWHLTAIPERLSGCMLGAAIMPVPRHYGNHCHQSTVNAPFVTLIFVSAYEQVLPQNRHRAVGKESGKKIENHIGAIWNFIHYYNAEIAPKPEAICNADLPPRPQ